MFTGIIMDVGKIVAIDRETEQTHMHFSTSLDTSRWSPGDSVAVDGCCLTITGFPAAGQFSATLSRETLNLTRHSDVKVGERVNLEPALCVGDPLGGHIVTGHVDGIATVDAITEIGEHRILRFIVPASLAKYVVKKGSVAINGASLTVNEVENCSFTVNLIPHTLSHTNLGELRVGSAVNFESDMLGRYVERIMSFQNRQEL
ncbi:MAG: riboflavin synthase [Mariprofundaceae bacterium]|nr:riboflavin synthase [Mariprofundaceae bacterium]